MEENRTWYVSHQGILGKFRKWCVCVCMNVHICLWSFMYVCASVHACLCVCVCIFVYVCAWMYACMCLCACVYARIDGVLMNVCTCVYNCVFTSVYTCACILVWMRMTSLGLCTVSLLTRYWNSLRMITRLGIAGVGVALLEEECHWLWTVVLNVLVMSTLRLHIRILIMIHKAVENYSYEVMNNFMIWGHHIIRNCTQGIQY